MCKVDVGDTEKPILPGGLTHIGCTTPGCDSPAVKFFHITDGEGFLVAACDSCTSKLVHDIPNFCWLRSIKPEGFIIGEILGDIRISSYIEYVDKNNH